MIRVLLVDDHPVVRSGLKTLLGNVIDCEVCGEAVNGQEAVEKVLQLRPDLVLMDISMPIMNGLQATKAIRSGCPQTRIIMLTMHDSIQIADEAKAAGAHGYLRKACPLEELRTMIVDVCRKDERPQSV